MSTEKETHTQVVTPGQSTDLYPWAMNVLSYTSAVARVAIHATEAYDGPDTLILCSTDGLGPPEEPLAKAPSVESCQYYKSIPVSDATLEGRRIDLSFTADGNEGTADLPATEAEEILSTLEFALCWAPTGKPKVELIDLFSCRAYEEVWSAGEQPSFAAHLLATQFAEATEVSLPEEDHKPFYDEKVPLRVEPEPAPGSEGSIAPERDDARTDGPFVEPRWKGARPVASRSFEQNEGSQTSNENETALPPPPGDRWIYLARHNSARPLTPPELLGVYKATEEGTYERARFQANGTLSVEGPAQEQVLLPLNTPRTSDDEYLWTIDAWLSPFPVSKTRVEEVLDTLPVPDPDEPAGGVVPFCGGVSTGPNPRVFTQPRDYPSPDKAFEGHVGAVSHNLHVALRDGSGTTGSADPSIDEAPHLLLPHPLAVLERRVGIVERAHDRYEEWTQKMGGAELVSELVSATCHGNSHGRGYLDKRLRREAVIEETVEPNPSTGGMMPQRTEVQPIEETYDMVSTWEDVPVQNEETQKPSAHTLLAHFVHGAKNQRRYLRRRYRRARTGLRRLFRDESLVEAFVLDALRSTAEEEYKRQLLDHFFCLFPRCVSVGATGGVSALMDQAGTLRSMATADTPIQPFEKAADLPLTDIATSPTFKALFKLAQESPDIAHTLAPALAPTIASWAVGREVSLFDVSAEAQVPAMIAATRVHASWKPDHLGETARLNVVEEIADESGAGRRTVRVSIEGYDDYRVTAVREASSKTSGDGVPSAAANDDQGLWTLDATGKVEVHLQRIDDELREMGVRLDLAGVVIDTYSILHSARSGTFGSKEAVDAAKTMAEAGGIFAEVRQMASTASRLSRVASVFDMVSSTIAAFQQASDTDTRGQSEVYDPNVLGTIGASASALSAAVSAGGLAVGIGSGGTALLAGVVGSGAIWVAEWLDRKEKRRADPLWEWLPATTWGTESTADLDTVFDLVRPGRDREAPSLVNKSGPAAGGRRSRRGSSDLFADSDKSTSGFLRGLQSEAQTFTEKGFHFPASVSVRHTQGADDGPVLGLDLKITLGYVAQFGTLMVDATVSDLTTGHEQPLQCAVHFITEGDDFRYRVLAADDALRLPSEDASLRDCARADHWAFSETVDYTSPNGQKGEAEALSVHVGQWPEEWNSKVRREKARRARRMHVDEDLFIDEALRAVNLHPGKNADAVQVANYQRAKRILATVAPASMVPGIEGLAEMLEAGQFDIAGTVFFSPLQPLQPSSLLPASGLASNDRLLAREIIRFSYP